MAKKRVTVEDWIVQVFADPDKGKPCTAIGLVHVKGVGYDEIHTKEFAPGVPQDPKALAQFFVDRAEATSQDLPGVQTFKLLAFYGKNEPQNHHYFTAVEGSLTAGTSDTPFSRHEPTQVGILAQLMKHNETVMLMNTDIVRTYAVASLEREHEFRREQGEMTMILRDVLLNMNKEKHEMRLKELEFQRSTEERRMMGKALPTVINYLSGREVMPEHHADSELLDSLALKVQPEQLEMMVSAGFMTHEQAAVLAHRFQKARERAQQQADMVRTIPPETVPNGKIQ